MPRFNFHLHDDLDIPDEDGTEFNSLESAIACACDQARRFAGQMIIETGRIVMDHRIDIEDDAGAVLETIYFRDVITVEGEDAPDGSDTAQ